MRITVSMAAIAGIALFSTCATAADYSVNPRPARAEAVEQKSPYCGCKCGCPVVTFVRHRELRMGYSSDFDPRVLDEPHYYYGATKTYARFENNVPSRWGW